MPQQPKVTIDDLFDVCTQSAVHLELRDQYALGSHAEAFAAWRSTTPWPLLSGGV
jgi:hypothetical protein